MAPARDPSRRRRILDVAGQHFRQYGFTRTRLDAIAAETGCAKGSLYLEFESKEALLRAVAGEIFAAIRERYEAEVIPIASPLARIEATLRLSFDLMRSEPLFAKILADDPDLRALRADPKDEAVAAGAEIERILGWVDEGIAAGEIRDDVDREAVPHVLGALRFVPQHIRLATLGTFDEARVLDAVVDNFVAGLATPKARRRFRR